MENSSKEEADFKYEMASLKTALSEKEHAIRHLMGTHEKLKTTLMDEIAKLENEKRDLLSALDEVNLKREEREGTVAVCREEIERLRSLVAESQNKCKETDEWARSGKEVKMREDLLVQFEEERNKVEDQLKWKCEQFAHLEEAYKKLQSELRQLRSEKEVEKLELLNKLSEVESGLDEKTRLSEDLRTRLEICNQVLAREESKRKLLEVELRESRDRYDCLVTDFDSAKSALESVTVKRDVDIASLRCILSDKSLQIKEIENDKAQIEQENRELRASVKEHREIEIGGVEKSKKFRILEKAQGCGEKIRVREAEIENLRRDLHEKEEIVEKLQNELKGNEKIRLAEIDMENLKGELNYFRARLNEKTGIIEKLQDEIQERDLEQQTEMLKREEETRVALLVIKENLKEHFEKCCKSDVLIQAHSDEENNLKKREEALLEERERLLCEVGEKIGLIEQLKECIDRERTLARENERLISEVREREEGIEQLNVEREKFLEKENERKQVMKELEESKESLATLVKEKEMLLSEFREKEQASVRENKWLFCEIRQREGLIEELKGDNSRFQSEVCSHEEDKMKFVEIENEMAKKLLEIKFKLDPLEEKCIRVTKEKRNEISGLQMNLELLLEELESSVSEKEHLQVELRETATAYFLQKDETEFMEEFISKLKMEMEALKMNLELLLKELERSVSEKEQLQIELRGTATAYFLQKDETEFMEEFISELKMEMEALKMNLRVKEERFEAQLERERLESEGKGVWSLNEIKRLESQIDDLNCGIGSVCCADREIKAISDRVLQKIRNEGESTNEKKFKPLVPVAGTPRSPLKENNF